MIFEVKSIHQSNAVLDENSLAPYKLLNIQVKCHYEAQTNLRAVGPSYEEIVEDLTKTLRKSFLDAKRRLDQPSEGAEGPKSKIAIEPLENPEKKFGWFQIM